MRLILDPPASGRRNMALDEALLSSAGSGSSPATLRFYTFASATLSLGYSQPLTDVDLDAASASGLEVVRRPTGGRAVLHDRDLTYSVVQPIVAGESIAASYCRLSRAIVEAMAELGLEARIAPAIRPDPRLRPADCFAIATSADLVIAGRKLVGSAQVRRTGFLLQHGSIRLAPVRVGSWLGPGAAKSPSGSVAEVMGIHEPDLGWCQAIGERLARAIAGQLAVPWLPATWTPQELQLADAISVRSASELRPPGRPAALQMAGG